MYQRGCGGEGGGGEREGGRERGREREGICKAIRYKAHMTEMHIWVNVLLSDGSGLLALSAKRLFIITCTFSQGVCLCLKINSLLCYGAPFVK